MIATHVSSPIRSASASGPIGCVKPSFAIVSIASALRDPVVQRPHRLVDEWHQDAVRDEAGEVVRLGGCLPELARELDDAAAVSSDVDGARIDLDQRHHRYGVEEMHADHPVRPPGYRRQRRDRDRRRVRREDRLRRQRLVGLPEDLAPSHPHPRRPPRSSDPPERDPPPARYARAPRPAPPLPSPRASRGSSASPRARAAQHPARRRTAPLPVPTRPRPARCRRPSGRRRRRGRARSSRAEAYGSGQSRPSRSSERENVAAVGDGRPQRGYTSSSSASPWPPPEQIAASPSPPPSRRSS